MRYVIGTNVPGYLPEQDEPATAETVDEARAFLAIMLEEDWDHDTESDPQGVDGRYLPAHTEVNLMSVPGSVFVPGPAEEIHALGRVYFIEVAED